MLCAGQSTEGRITELSQEVKDSITLVRNVRRCCLVIPGSTAIIKVGGKDSSTIR